MTNKEQKLIVIESTLVEVEPSIIQDTIEFLRKIDRQLLSAPEFNELYPAHYKSVDGYYVKPTKEDAEYMRCKTSELVARWRLYSRQETAQNHNPEPS